MSVVTATLVSEGKVMDPYYELMSITIMREVNRIPWAQLVLLDGDPAKQSFALSSSGFFAPGKQVEILLRYEGADDTQVFKGIVLKQRLESGTQGSYLSLELKNAAFKLMQQRRSQVFYNKSDTEIIAELLKAHKLAKGKIDKTTTKHSEMVQYACTDWDFLATRAEANGLLLFAEDEAVSAQALSLSAKPKHVFEYGISALFDFELEVDASHQYNTVESQAWDCAEQKMTAAAKGVDTTLTQGNLKGKSLAEKWQKEAQQLSTSVSTQASELKAWAQATLQKSRLSLLRGRLSMPGLADIALLDMIEISGTAAHFNGKTIVTGIRHEVDVQGWQTHLQFGLPADYFSEKYKISETPAAGLLAAVNGLQIGLIDAFQEDPDGQFRLKVILPTVDEKKASIWARLAVPDAGVERGYFFPPEAGDEVVVGFLNDDPREAIILGALYSSKNKPPQSFTLNKENIEKAIVSRAGTTLGFVDDKKASVFIETPSANTLLLSDETEGISLSDQHGNHILLDANGIQLKSGKDVIIEASGNVTIKGSKVDVN